MMLLTRPGVLTSDYFDGRRARWISPVRLYLVFSAVYFAFMSFGQDGIRDRTAEAAAYMMILLVPVFAWLVGLVAGERKNYPQHLYSALHVHAAWFTAFALMEASRWVLSHWLNSAKFVGRLAVGYVAAYVLLATPPTLNRLPSWTLDFRLWTFDRRLSTVDYEAAATIDGLRPRGNSIRSVLIL